MQNLLKLFGIIALVAVIGFSMVACDDGSGDDDNNGGENGNGGNGTTITYTVSANGSSSSTTTALTFTFSADPGALTASNITVSGTASKGSATVSGIGNSRTLSPITVSANGSANISITKDGVETGTKNVTVYSGGGGGGGTPGTFTVTGIPSQYNGKEVFFYGYNSDFSEGLLGGMVGTSNFDPNEWPLPLIVNGSISMSIFMSTNGGDVYEAYTGNGTFDCAFAIFDNWAEDDDPITYIVFPSITFSNGGATRTWSQGQ